jgi:mannose-6-phosphate isomerase-like protein (cupin superfamily)
MLNVIVRAIGRKFELCALPATLAVCAALSVAQASQGVSVKTPRQMDDLQSALRQQATTGDGVAAAFLEQYPHYYTQLIVRTKSGEVEIHQEYDELMIVRDGNAAVYTGGKPQSFRTIKPGELRGPAVSGSTPTALVQGTLVYIPVGTPHQVIVPLGGAITYIDVKIAHR